jgi:hypothetical protein
MTNKVTLNRSRTNTRKRHHLRNEDTSPVQSTEFQNQDSLRRARNAERKRSRRHSRQANETFQKQLHDVQGTLKKISNGVNLKEK